MCETECDCYKTVNYGNDTVVLHNQRKGHSALLYPCYQVCYSLNGAIKMNVNIESERIVQQK